MDGIGRLYVVATPIGNMDELTPRAVEVLSSIDMVAAEDTRVSGLLLHSLGIKKRLVSCHKFNEMARLDEITGVLLSGQSVALVTDAGTPCISDPGHLLVARAAELGIEVVGVSGACAAVTALSVCGFDIREYLYIGFLSRERGAQREKLLALPCYDDHRVVVFYESPKRILETMRNICDTLPDSLVCLCNDLTKKFERVYRGNPSEVITELEGNPNREKGEYTCVLKCPVRPVASDDICLEAQLVDIMVSGGFTLKDAVSILSGQDKRHTKKEIYAASLRLKELLQ